MRDNIKKLIVILLAFVLFIPYVPYGISTAVAESYEGYEQVGGIDSYIQDGYNVILTLTSGEKIRVQFYKDDMIRIYMDPTGEFQENPTPNREYHTTNLVVKDLQDYIDEGEAVEPTVSDENGVLTISSGLAQLRINKDNSLMTLLKGDKVIWEESKPLNHNNGSTIQTLKNHENEYFFGGGMQNGRFTHRGEKIRIVNENGWTDGQVTSPAPFYWSTNGYGVIRNTFKPGEYDFGSQDINIVTTTHNEDKMDAIYFIGETPEEVLGQYTDISGKPELQTEFSFYPAHLNAYNRDTWVEDPNGRLFEDGKTYKEYQPGDLGNRQGFKETLNGDDQFSGRAVINRYENHDMPLGWFLPNDGYGAGYGQTDTLDGDIENLRQFTEYANARGIETGLWTQQDLHPKDPENPQKGERDINKEINIAGVRALKTDVAWVGPGYSFGLDGIDDVSGLFNEINARSTIVTLDGWVGTHRYGNVWSGDQSGGQWEYIRFHIPTYIGSGLSSLNNVSSDMDGIFGGSPLIMTRDTQWKTFTSMMLYMDGWGAYQKNPWEHGEPYASINRNYLKLKSQLLPYHYTINEESANTGVPYLKAMFLEYPNAYTYSKATQYQYLFGPSFLVAPVYQDTQMNPETYDDIRNGIYLPEGETWIDYFTGKQYDGGQILNQFDAPFWKLPLFVKNDSIIPMYKPNNNPSDIDRSYRIFDIYAQDYAEFEVYEDDGKSLDYKNGESATTKITANVDGDNLKVVVNPTQGSYPEMVNERTSEFRVNVSQEPTKLIASVGGSNVELTKVNSQEEFEAGSNVYYYNQAPDFNQFSTADSEFESVEIKKTPAVYVKIDKTNISANNIELTVEGFVNDGTTDVTATELPKVPTNFNGEPTFDSIKLSWDEQDNTETYEIEFEDQVYSNIQDTTFDMLDLESDTEYTFKIRARNTLGVSEWSEPITVKTELDPLRNAITPVSTSLTATDQGGTPFSNMFDFDTKTQWHTTWGMSQTPMSGTIDLGKIYELDKLEYYPREDAGNGTITSYSIDLSMDGRNWIEGDTLTWARTGETKLHDFGEGTARYIRININDAVGGFGSGREFFILKDDDTEGVLLGDTNSSNTVDASDLTFFTNYSGLKTVDSDWPGYVSRFDYNGNGLIDAYDINLVQTLANGRNYTDSKNIAGNITVTPDKTSVSAGETVTLTIEGTKLFDLNAFTVELGYDPQDFEVVSNNPQGKVADWASYSKVRTHSDGTNNIYVTYGSDTANSVNGDVVLATLELKALRDVAELNIPTISSLMVDSNLFTKEGDAVDQDVDAIKKIPNSAITVTGDESAYENKFGSPLSNVNDGDRGTLAELMWDYEPNYDENGKLPENVKLPQEITLSVEEAVEKLDHVTIVKRPNSNGSIKDVVVEVYNGDQLVLTKEHTFANEDSIAEISTDKVPATKVVVTVLNTYDDVNTMMTVNEIELYGDFSVDPVQPSEKISHTDIVVTGRDYLYEVVGGAPLSNVNDGDRESLAELMWDWEPNWDENGNLPEEVKLPQEITLTPNKPVESLEKITVVKRPNGNGSIKNIKVDVYNGDEIVFTTNHELAVGDKLVDIATENVAATKVVVTVLDTYDNTNNMMTIAEIELYGILGEATIEEPEVDKTALSEAIDKANAIDTEGKTQESVAALQEAIANATQVLANEDASQEDVNQAVSSLEAAINALEDEPVVEIVDASALETLLEKARSIDTNTKTTESAQRLIDAIFNADQVVNNLERSQEDVDKAIQDIVDALAGLEDKEEIQEPEEPAVDKTNLEKLVDNALKVNTTDKTEESVAIFDQALDNAYSILDSDQASQEEVDSAVDQLLAAITGLELKEQEPIQEPEVVDKSALETLVDKISGLDQTNLTQESKDNITNALEEARQVLANEQASKEQVQDQVNKLVDLLLNLEEVEEEVIPETPEIPVNKDLLGQVIERAQNIDTSDKTEESVNNLNSQIAQAKEILENSDSTQEQVDLAVVRLVDAIIGLTAKEVEPEVVKVKPRLTSEVLVQVKENEPRQVTYVSNGEYPSFVKVEINGQEVARENYNLEEGSTILTFTQDYIDSLEVGTHLVEMFFNESDSYLEGSVNGVIEILAVKDDLVIEDGEDITIPGETEDELVIEDGEDITIPGETEDDLVIEDGEDITIPGQPSDEVDKENQGKPSRPSRPNDSDNTGSSNPGRVIAGKASPTTGDTGVVMLAVTSTLAAAGFVMLKKKNK